MLLPERDCATCTEANKKEWGCHARLVSDENGERWENAATLPVKIDGKDQWRCPVRPMLDDPREYGYIMNTLGHYRQGFLPYAGGIQDQPYLLMQYMVIALDQVSKCEAQRAENANSGRPPPQPPGRVPR
jgi:hypothetical protein